MYRCEAIHENYILWESPKDSFIHTSKWTCRSHSVQFINLLFMVKMCRSSNHIITLITFLSSFLHFKKRKGELSLMYFIFFWKGCQRQVVFFPNDVLVLLSVRMVLQQGWCFNTEIRSAPSQHNESWHYIKHNKESQLMKIIPEHTNLLKQRKKYQFYTLASQKKMWFVI